MIGRMGTPRKFLYLLLFSVGLATTTQAQNWSGIVAPSRAVDWSKSGLPARFSDGETTPNPWTPPTRTQCGATVPAGTSFATINSDLAACAPGTYLLLGPGNFSSSTTGLTLGNHNNVTLRGSGADKTLLSCTGTCTVNWQSSGLGQSSTTWTAGFSQGTTVITVGSAQPVGTMVILVGDGSTSDNGGVWTCAAAGVCSSQGGVNSQYEGHIVTAVSGSNITIAPAIAFPTFASLANRRLTGIANFAVGVGLEDLSIDTSGELNFSYTYASWIKGVRLVNGTSNPQISIKYLVNCLVSNSYLVQTGPPTSELLNPNTTGFNLILNNIFASAGSFIQAPGLGDVYGFNLARDAFNSTPGSTYVNNTISNHTNAYSKTLVEGSEIGNWQDDNIHGTTNLNTFFRNVFYGTDPPYNVDASHGWALEMAGVARFENVIGNVMGNPNDTSYKCTTGAGDTCILAMGSSGYTGINDALSVSSAMLWGNYDTVTGAVRWCGNSNNPGWTTTCAGTSEIPISLGGNAAAYSNPVPSSTTLPASFFLPTTAHPSGGTGLSWWKVCTNYPTCSTSQTQPFPPIGPDVTGGDINGTGGFPNYRGYAYHIPAYVAWKNLPIDTTYQKSYSITASSWSSGIETLTVSGLSTAPVGEFQVTGACAGTFVISNSTSTTISYALASNPGSCSGGSFKFPDIRQFNEAVYQSDPGRGGPAPPTNVAAVVQ